MMKICTECGRKLPLTTDYFEKRKANKEGFRNKCRECRGRSFKNVTISNKTHKKCRICKENKVLDTLHFRLSNRNSDGFKNICISCEEVKRNRNFDAVEKICIKCNMIYLKNASYFTVDTECYDGYRNICKRCSRTKNKQTNVKFTGVNQYNEWTAEEDALLKEIFISTPNDELVNLFPRHTYNSIRGRARDILKLKKDMKERYWTTEQDEYLKEYYSIASMEELLDKLDNKTSGSIIARAGLLGVGKDTFWSEEELNDLKNHFKDMSSVAFRNIYMPKRSIHSINTQAQKYGIFKSQKYLNTQTKSNGEWMIAQLLDKYDIAYCREYTFDDLTGRTNKKLRFDFYIDELNLCIEYNGIQHYEPIERFGGEKQFKLQQNNDYRKQEYCEKNNIELLIIPYWQYDEIEEMLLNIIMK